MIQLIQSKNTGEKSVEINGRKVDIIKSWELVHIGVDGDWELKLVYDSKDNSSEIKVVIID